MALAHGTLDWDTFFVGWMRMARRIVLGDAARDDEALTDLLEKLRCRANFGFLSFKARRHRQELSERLDDYVSGGVPESLAGQMARRCTDPMQMPQHQLPQYLFAFDPGGMASFRALALLSIDGGALSPAADEVQESADETVPRLTYLRACLLESLRLWPTTPAILRETTEAVAWHEGKLAAGTQVIIFTPFFHRDEERLADANQFRPNLWMHSVSHPEIGLVPFSHGPVQCPAAHFVPMVASLALRRILSRLELRLTEPERLQVHRLPGTLNNFTLHFKVSAHQAKQQERMSAE